LDKQFAELKGRGDGGPGNPPKENSEVAKPFEEIADKVGWSGQSRSHQQTFLQPGNSP
jgi:hypothetical protein